MKILLPLNEFSLLNSFIPLCSHGGVLCGDEFVCVALVATGNNQRDYFKFNVACCLCGRFTLC